MKYNLKDINNLSYSGFNYEIPENTLIMINYLCTHVGSIGINSPIFVKKENVEPNSIKNNKGNDKRKRNKTAEVSNDEWESIRSFQPTKIEQKSGIDGELDQIRFLLNKLTDKTYLEIREKVINQINKILAIEKDNEEDLNNKNKLGNIIFDLASTNKFYSKIYADLFCEMLNQYDWLRNIFDEKFNVIMEVYNDIIYIDADKDYDGFCEMNKQNEKRRAITSFIVNLSINNYIKKIDIINILKKLLEMVMDMITENEKKNEVDEITESIAILYGKDRIDAIPLKNGKTILESINSLARSKAKDFPSLSNKAIFKYMDLVDM